MKEKQLVIPGQPITKKNSQVIRCINGYPLVNQSKAYRAYEKMALKAMLAYPGETIVGPVTVKVLYWLKDRRRPDLTNLLQATADILEKAGVIANDRNIVSWDGSRIMGVSRKPQGGDYYQTCLPEARAMDLKLEFYVGIHDIAEFLGLHWKTCARYLREGKIVAARRDSLGRWVLSNLDYYRSLKDVRPSIES